MVPEMAIDYADIRLDLVAKVDRFSFLSAALLTPRTCRVRPLPHSCASAVIRASSIGTPSSSFAFG